MLLKRMKKTMLNNDICCVGGKVGIYNEKESVIKFGDGSTSTEEPDLVLRMTNEDLPMQLQGKTLPVLEYGNTGMFVYLMQALLCWHRFTVKLDGSFGLQTIQALRAFRQQHYMSGDTVCDELTWSELLTE